MKTNYDYDVAQLLNLITSIVSKKKIHVVNVPVQFPMVSFLIDLIHHLDPLGENHIISFHINSTQMFSKNDIILIPVHLTIMSFQLNPKQQLFFRRKNHRTYIIL